MSGTPRRRWTILSAAVAVVLGVVLAMGVARDDGTEDLERLRLELCLSAPDPTPAETDECLEHYGNS